MTVFLPDVTLHYEAISINYFYYHLSLMICLSSAIYCNIPVCSAVGLLAKFLQYSDLIYEKKLMMPLPLLVWNEGKWTSDLILQSWAGFRLPKGNWNAVEVTKESNGSTKLIVEVPNGEQSPPCVEQTKAFQNLLDNEKVISGQILQAIFDIYPEQKSAYGLDGEQADDTMPNIKQPEDLKQLIGLSKVYVLHEGHDSVPYIGFEFGCTWDSSHGLGVMTHNGRVMIVSDAEAANTAWIAEDSNESS